MRALFCGVRGSTPSPGAEFARVGGHTSCVALAHGDGIPVLLLDAGTGLRRVTAALEGRAFRGTILLTHLHWDHLQGLPFFAAGDRDDAAVTLVMPEQGDPVEVLARGMSPPHFPIGPDGLRGAWRFSSLEPGPARIEAFEVTAYEVPHKGGRTFGYRVTDGHATLAYLPDHAPHELGAGPDGHGVRHDAALECAAGVDVLVHGAQFLDTEREIARLYGHATVDYAVALAQEAGVGTLVLFHHAPGRTDDQVERIARDVAASTAVTVVAASEGLELAL